MKTQRLYLKATIRPLFPKRDPNYSQTSAVMAKDLLQ